MGVLGGWGLGGFFADLVVDGAVCARWGFASCVSCFGVVVGRAVLDLVEGCPLRLG